MEQLDVDLIIDIKAGDAYAFRALYDRYWKRIYSRAILKLPKEEDAEDLTQDVFYSVWKRREEISINSSLEAYLFTILRYKIYDFYQIKRLASIDNSQEFQLASNKFIEDDFMDTLIVKDLEAIIEKEVKKMPERMQEIYRLSRQSELSASEIAEKLNISVQTVRNQISAALSRIRASLEKQDLPKNLFVFFFFYFLK